MSVYIITLILVCILCYLAEEYDWPEIDNNDRMRVLHTPDAQKFYFMAALVLICVAGFRYRVGMDYMAYYKAYRTDIANLPYSLRTLNEPGFGIIAWIATRFYDDGAAVIFLSSLVTIALPLIINYRYTDQLLFTTFLYVTVGAWGGSFNGVRQYLAAAILFCGYRFLRERNLIGYCIIVFTAFLFHRSAIVFLILYVVAISEASVRNTVFIILVSVLILLSYDRVFQIANFIMDAEYSLQDAYTAASVNRLRILATFIPTVVFIYFYYGKTKGDAENFALNILIIRTASAILAMNSALLYRINIYISLFTPLAITELIKGISKDNKRIVIGLLALLYMIMWWYEIYKSNSMNNFHWIWERVSH